MRQFAAALARGIRHSAGNLLAFRAPHSREQTVYVPKLHELQITPGDNSEAVISERAKREPKVK